METSASLHMETFSSILYILAIFIRLKNAKTSGKKDSVSMEYAANFSTHNVQKGQVN